LNITSNVFINEDSVVYTGVGLSTKEISQNRAFFSSEVASKNILNNITQQTILIIQKLIRV